MYSLVCWHIRRDYPHKMEEYGRSSMERVLLVGFKGLYSSL